jgi:hypothetical protein
LRQMPDAPDPGFDWTVALALPRRTRLALALASARRGLTAFEDGSRKRKVGVQALSHGWRWILRPHYDLGVVEETVEKSILPDSRAPERQRAAFEATFAAILVLYVCARYPANTFQDPPPQDLLASVLAAAQRASADSARERAWQLDTLQRLLAAHAGEPEALGTICRPSQFGFPEDDLDEKAETRKAKKDIRHLRSGEVISGVIRSFLPDRVVIGIG